MQDDGAALQWWEKAAAQGNDRILGLSGDDVLKGGRGYDSLYGEEGDDTLLGETGSDMLNGGGGDDRICGHGGDDVIVGGTGDNRIDGGDGDDVLIGSLIQAFTQALEVEVEYYKAPATFSDGPPLRISASAVYGIAPPQKCIKTDFLGLWSGPNLETTPRLRIPAFADVGMLLTQDTKARPASGLYLNLYGTNQGGIVLAQYDLTEKAEATVMQGAEFYTIYLDAPGRFYLNQSWTIIA